jgi:hypothetical protein
MNYFQALFIPFFFVSGIAFLLILIWIFANYGDQIAKNVFFYPFIYVVASLTFISQVIKFIFM